MSEQPTPLGQTWFDCATTGDSVECSDANTKSQILVPIQDILCLIPNNRKYAHGYTMLFIQKNACSPNSTWNVEGVLLRSAPSKLLSGRLLSDLPSHLNHSRDRDLKLHIIISTASGRGTANIYFNQTLQQLFDWIGVEQYEVHQTHSPQTITELCHSVFIPQAEAGVPQTIVLLSGDGGIGDIIDSFYGTQKGICTMPNIALVPEGTGNALATSTGLVTHPKAPLIALLRGKPCPLPVFVATFSDGANYVQDGPAQPPLIDEHPSLTIYGGIVASWGIHASLVADSDSVEYRKFGADRFKMAAEELLFPPDGSETHKYSGTITLTRRVDQHNFNHEEILEHKKHMYVLVTLVSNLEKDFMISPESAALDGSLRILRFGPMEPQRAMALLSAAYRNGQHVQDDEVMYTEIEEFRIDFHEADKRWRRVCIDGRVIVAQDKGWMRVQKERRRLVNILLPDLI
ncbi:hypothetical protein ASPVEDRAFT_184775 [Aspergillus versicolor CBS 583.65]|uniref:DAGKc domain-containing protein n=1 Tax=Aspergillus versicolor CBS 583.65 TaxID=1036611 RepID=A0A1L9P890_ASPVE|nr:uncharacterized protein ASPVEDRAFT_184775 [Aspergillus versicolor CBS 583.65]OJI97715.1 hypothetical protein ASPVEDRAFT_184775 [Aspergillus versicolor CBS 583.65]